MSTLSPAAVEPASPRIDRPHPFGLSTAWNGARHAHMEALLDEHLRLGFHRLEAYAHFTPEQLRRLAAGARERGIAITSLHSPCPVPLDGSGARVFLGDWLSSTVERERTLAVDALKGTIDAAAEIGARGIVVHLGNTGVVSRQRAIFDTIQEHGFGSDAHRRLLGEALREREAAKGPHLDAAIRTMRTLGEHAKDTPVRLGLECRDGYHEIPSLDEFQVLFDACEELPVFYWHDAGHGAKLQNAGVLEHEEYLRRYGGRLLGMHLHDTIGPRDHLAPGLGQTDLAMVARYVRPETIKTLELHASNTAEQVVAGAERMLDLLPVEAR